MLAFSRAVTGLRIAEQNLYVTSNNLSNVETQGYHRQRLNQYSFQSTNSGSFPVGLGVDADTVRQIRSEFLETNYRNELASFGEYKYESKVYDGILSIVGNDGAGVTDCLNDLWESFNELTKEYTTSVAGGYLRENAVSFVEEMNSIEEQLDKMQNELDVEVDNVVKKINDYATRIAQLNDKINRSEADGSLACELRDSRDSMIADLANLVEIQVEQPNNTCVNIRTANGYLVVRTSVNKLSTAKITPGSTMCSPIWEEAGIEFEVGAGELKGILDMRGGEDLIANLEHSSNGNPKEKMDVVISIDTKMTHQTIDDMVRNFSDMLDTLDRQDANYQLYLADGTKVNKDDLQKFMNYLYLESAELEVQKYDTNPDTSISGFMDSISSTYGKEAQLLSDIWGYVDSKINGGFDINDFKAYISVKKADPNLSEAELEKLTKMEGHIADYIDGKGTTFSGFNEYLSTLTGEEVEELKNYTLDYIDENVNFDANDIIGYLRTEYNDATMLPANSENVLANITQATNIDFRPDCNKYLLVFTDDKINNTITANSVASLMNKNDMRLIAVTNEDSKTSWRKLAQDTNGNVFNIDEFRTDAGTENIALSITRDFNSRLNATSSENGITFFRAGLNTLLNGFVKEINGIFRQGENIYKERHGDVMKDKAGNIMKDDETGETLYHNFDLFVKIDDSLPFQMGNVKINPVFSDLNKMPLSLTGETGDFQIGNMLVDLQSTDIFNSGDDYSTLDEYYSNFMLDFGQASNIALTGYETQEAVVGAANDKIQMMSGVSMDEELSNMLKFQHSYTASSKMISVIDEMLETIVSL